MKDQVKLIGGGSSLLKAILQALFILAISAGIAQGILFPRLEGMALESMQQWEVEYLSSGTIELVAEQISQLSKAEQGSYLKSIKPDFGFDIALRPIEEIQLDPQSAARLQRFETVGDPATYSAYRLLARGEQVLVFDKIKVPAKHLLTEAQRRHKGTLTVVEQFLKQSPLSNEDAARALYNRFGYPVKIDTLEDLNLANGDMADLLEGRIVTIATEESTAADYPAEIIYKKVDDAVITLGPFSPPTLARFYPVIITYYVILGLFVLLPLVIWLIPTWRSMNQLTSATNAFGRGGICYPC